MNFTKIALGLACALSFSTAVYVSAADKVPTQKHDSAWILDQMGKQKGYNWKTSTWTEDSAPYNQIRQSVNKLVQQGQKPAELEQLYRAPAAQDFYNPRAQFRWAYAAYLAVRDDSNYQRAMKGQLMYRVLRAMDGTLKPRAYEWTRLRFLWGIMDRHSKELIPVGERVLKHNPKDVEAQYRFIELLNHSDQIKDLNRAVALAEKLVQSDPKIARYHTSLGGSYMIRWWKSNQRADGMRALDEYKTYLHLAPDTEPFRKDAKWFIQDIEAHRDEQGHYKAKKSS